MKVIIIPDFTGYPEEVTFENLGEELVKHGHDVVKIAWPYLPQELDKYNFTNTINYCREILDGIDSDDLIILGFSMGGIIATVLASEYNLAALGLIVTPYQAGTGDDLAGKYGKWKEMGYRELTSSKFGDLKIPFTFIEDARKYNALDSIFQIYCPKLFVVGENDTKVSLKVSRTFYNKANDPKEWCQISGMDHKYQYQPEILKEVNKIIVRFVEYNS